MPCDRGRLPSRRVRRILVVSYFHSPSPGIGGTRWLAMSRYLRELGHSVTILASDAWGTLPDDKEQGVVRVSDLRSSHLLRRLLRRGDLRSADGTDLELPPTALLTRVVVPDAGAVHWLPALLVTARRLLRNGAYDCLVTSSPLDSVHLVGLALRHPPAWIADFRDGWTFQPMGDPFPTAAQRELNEWLERHVVKTAEASAGATEPIAADLRNRLGANAAWVTNAWDPSLEPSIAHIGHAADDGVVRLVYTGTLIGPRRSNPEPFLRALALVNEEQRGRRRMQLVHAGRLTTEERALIANTHAADAVRHVGRLDRAAALALQRSANALVLLTSSNSSETTGKLFEYLASGRPIVALAKANEAERIVRETRTGITVPPDDVGAIIDALRIVASGELERRYTPRGLDEYVYPAPALLMAELVEDAIERHRRKSTPGCT